MDPKQIIALASKLVAHQEELEALETDEGQWAIQKPSEAMALMITAIKQKFVSETKKAVLTPWKTTHLPDKRKVDLVLLSLRQLGFTSQQPYGKFLTPRFCKTWSNRHMVGSGRCIKLLESMEPDYWCCKLRGDVFDQKSLSVYKRIWAAEKDHEPYFFRWEEIYPKVVACHYNYLGTRTSIGKGIFPLDEVFVFELATV